MPPRLGGSLKPPSLTLCIRPRPGLPILQPLIQVANASSKESKALRKPTRQIEKYLQAQREQRAAALKQRQAELKRQREDTTGDPVRGITTPFVASFDTAGRVGVEATTEESLESTTDQAASAALSPHILNHWLTQQELDDAIAHAYRLTKPLPASNSGVENVGLIQNELKEHEEAHGRASEALARLMTLDNAGAKARMRANMRRVIETFGRHNTDHTLERPEKPLAPTQPHLPKPIRGGPDTGSSEVQIGILTAKIRALANAMEMQPHSQHDKANKRNLRLLVHRRQKLLRYMERKERGSGRWQHMIEELGLTPAAWKREISL